MFKLSDDITRRLRLSLHLFYAGVGFFGLVLIVLMLVAAWR